MTERDLLIGYVGKKPLTAGDVNLSFPGDLTDWLCIATLTVVAGYQFEDEIQLHITNQEINKNLKSLELFLSYLLSYPPTIPHKFNLHIGITGGTQGILRREPISRNDNIVLASGGIDSTAGLM